MDVRIENCGPWRVAFVRHVGPYAECQPAWNKLMAFAGQNGLFNDKTRFIGIGHDNPQVTPPDKIRYDACVTVDEHVQASGDVGVKEIPGGQYAIATLRGPCSGLADAWRWIFEKWLPTSGRKFGSGQCFELYVTNAMTTPPEDQVTEIYVPVT